MQNCLGACFVSSISLIRLLITSGTSRMNLHLKTTWKSHLLHTVAIHLLMGISHQNFVTSVPHWLHSLPVHFQICYYTLVRVPLNGLVPWYPKNMPLSSCVTRRQDQQKGLKNVTCFPDNDCRLWAGWLIGPMAKPVFSSRFFDGRRKGNIDREGGYESLLGGRKSYFKY